MQMKDIASTPESSHTPFQSIVTPLVTHCFDIFHRKLVLPFLKFLQVESSCKDTFSQYCFGDSFMLLYVIYIVFSHFISD